MSPESLGISQILLDKLHFLWWEYLGIRNGKHDLPASFSLPWFFLKA